MKYFPHPISIIERILRIDLVATVIIVMTAIIVNIVISNDSYSSNDSNNIIQHHRPPSKPLMRWIKSGEGGRRKLQ